MEGAIYICLYICIFVLVLVVCGTLLVRSHPGCNFYGRRRFIALALVCVLAKVV